MNHQKGFFPLPPGYRNHICNDCRKRFIAKRLFGFISPKCPSCGSRNTKIDYIAETIKR